MADYLNNLIAKNLSLQEIVRPRLPSRFETPMRVYAAPEFHESPQPVEQSVESLAPPTQESPSRESPISPPAGRLEQRPAPQIFSEPAVRPDPEQPYRGRLGPRMPSIREVTKVMTPESLKTTEGVTTSIPESGGTITPDTPCQHRYNSVPETPTGKCTTQAIREVA